jgi:tyrosinase
VALTRGLAVSDVMVTGGGNFSFNTADPNSWRVRVAANASGDLLPVNRGLRRRFASSVVTGLPKNAHVATALMLDAYDASRWDTSSNGFRNRLEGWSADPGFKAPWLHNAVHVWVGGDMSCVRGVFSKI